MSFSIFELSRFKGKPLNLYYFKIGPGANDYYAFTDGERELTLSGVVYSPVQIRRGRISSSGSLDKSTLEIQVPKTNPLFEIYRVYPPNFVVTMIVKQGHYGDPDNQFLSIWSGRVINFSIEGNEVSFSCEPVGTSTRRPGLRRNYQYGCPHDLYGASTCKATKVGTPFVIQALTGGTLTLPNGWNGSLDAAKFIGGLVEWSPSSGALASRSIIRASGNVLTIAGLTQGLSIGDSVNVIVGCNHQMSDCSTIHGNIPNFGGQPWIPTENPIGYTNQYY